MASTEAAIRRLEPAQAPACLPLSVEAGWNQVEADWRFMLEAGTGFGVELPDGRLGASALVLPVGEGLRWISMVLVTAALRRQGLGTELLRRCIAEAERGGNAMGLDATELGRPVYLPLGFRDLYRISRWRLERKPAAMPAPAGLALRPLSIESLEMLLAWDSERSGLQRRAILCHLRGRQPGLALVAERGGAPVGFVLGREGRLASQIGPLVAEDDETALALLQAAIQASPAPYFIDVPDSRMQVRAWLEAQGGSAPRYFIRMVRGEAGRIESAGKVYAIGGPELA
ncbi:MAG: GNAT family N-acetyltransferase [Reyranellaceae bacterium]